MKKPFLTLVLWLSAIAFNFVFCQIYLPGQTRIIILGDENELLKESVSNSSIKHLIISEKESTSLKPLVYQICLDSFPSLEKLELWDVSTSIVTFSGKTKTPLRELIISNSPTFDIKHAVDFLARNSHLEILKLEGFTRPEMPSNISKLKTLDCVRIENCDGLDLKEFSEVLANCRALDHLEITGNNDVTAETSRALTNYPDYINLSENYLPDFPIWLINPEGVAYLNISGNDFELRDALYSLRKIPIDTLVCGINNANDTTYVRSMFPDSHIEFVYDTVDFDAVNIQYSGYIATSKISNFADYTCNYKSFEAPLKKSKTPFTTYLVNAEETQMIYTSGGTKINIPANSLTDALGNPVTGDYTVHFRDLNEPADVFLSGVPMTYDSGGVENIFESAGMFEIYASKDSVNLLIKPGEKIYVELPTTSTDIDFNLYRYNDDSGNWEIEESSANNIQTSTISSSPPTYSTAYQYLYLLKTVLFDTNTFANRYLLPQYARTRRMVDYFWGVKKDLFPFFKIKRAKTSYADRKKTVFNFPFTGKSKDPAIGPYKELLSYRTYDWLYCGSLGKSEFYKTYLRGKKWTDVRIDYDGGKTFSFELKSPKEFVSFDAVPVITTIKDESKLEKTFAKLDKRYDKSLQKSELRFNKPIIKKKLRNSAKNWAVIQGFMSQTEKNMSQAEWIKYAENIQSWISEANDTVDIENGNISRSLQIDGFGIWNCDRLFPFPVREKILATVIDQDNNKVEASRAFLINQSGRGVFPVEVVEGKVKYIFIPDAVCAICVVDIKDNLYVYSYNDYASFDNNNSGKNLKCVLLDSPDSKSLHAAMGF